MAETSIWYGITAHTLVLLHVLFILFVLFGGLLVFWKRIWIWFHLPAVIWAVLIELNGWICPLTPWENHFRALAGLSTYNHDFVAQYIFPLLYPTGLTREMQLVLGLSVLLINMAIYWWLIKSKKIFQ